MLGVELSYLSRCNIPHFVRGSPDVERKRPQVSVPSDDVERMMAVEIACDDAACLDANLEFPAFIDRQELGRRPEIPLGVGRALQELTRGAEVPPRRLDVPSRTLHHQHALIDRFVGQDAPDDAGRDHQVVAPAVAKRAELALQDTRSLVDEDHFRLDKLLNRTEQDLRQLEQREKELHKLMKENEKLKKEMEAAIETILR